MFLSREDVPLATRTRKSLAALFTLAVLLQGCRLFPVEFNLGPLYRHRLNSRKEVVSLDFLWPIFHYEKLPGGGWEFRVRPFYRKVSHPSGAEIHQFLWPLGYVASDPRETKARLFPLAFWRLHRNEKDQEDLDWGFLFPFFWGGSSESKKEDYFAFFPLYGRIPQFMSYDEAGWFLFPLYVWSEKGTSHTRSVLWPLFGEGWGDKKGDASWFRALPFYARSDKPGRWWNRAYLWPFFQVGAENLDGRDPRRYWFLFPLAGRSKGRDSQAWTFLWPFFRYRSKDPSSYKLDAPWPLFRLADETGRGPEGEPDRTRQWWITPFYSSTTSKKQWTRVILLPLFWMRKYRDLAMKFRGSYFLPFFWRTVTKRLDGWRDSTTRFFPLLAVDRGTQDGGWHTVRFPDPIPFRLDSGEGYRELYDFLWNLYTRRRRGKNVSVTTPANLFCNDRIEGDTTWSVPFLFHLEREKSGRKIFRLFHIIPIPLGGGGKGGG